MMRKTLLKSLYPISIYKPHSSSINGGTNIHQTPKPDPNPLLISNPKWVFTATAPPPPEWVQPINDTSNLITSHPKPSPWVDQILNLLDDDSSQMEPKLDAFCHKWFIRLPPSFISHILKSDRVKTRPDLAFRFFKWAELEIPPHAYSLVIGGLCRDGKPMEAYILFENMIQKGRKGNVAMYTALMDAYAKTGHTEEVIRIFERMNNDGFNPDEVTYGVIVNVLCKTGRLEEAVKYFELCRKNKVAVNAMFYSSLIDGFGKSGRLDEAEKLFEEMVNDGCSRDSFCYNALLDAFVKNEKIDEALVLFKRMETEGCDQTVYSYTIIMNGLFNKHRNEEALKIWDLMIDKGITPTAASVRVLATGLCLSGKVSRACKILDELAPMGVVIETACEDMINVLVKANRVDQACKLADGIVERGREIPGRVRTILINALRKSGNAEMAMKLMHSKIGIGYDRMGTIKRRVKFKVLVEK